MNHRTPGLAVYHNFPESTQSHVHWVGDAIQPSHLPLSPSPFALNLSQHQGHFQWVSSLHQVAKVLEFQLQHQSFRWILRTDLLSDGLVGSPCSPRDSQESSPTSIFQTEKALKTKENHINKYILTLGKSHDGSLRRPYKLLRKEEKWMKGKGEKEGHTHLNAEFQRTARRD